MARYTIELRTILTTMALNIFDFDYTLDSSITKEHIEERFKNKYWFREIGYETYEIWKFKFKQEWKNKLVKYNKLFKQFDVEINPFIRSKRNYQDTFNRILNDSQTSTNTSNSVGENKFKDTPTVGEFDTSDYLANVTKTESNDTNNGSVTKDGEEDTSRNIEETMTGKDIEMLDEYVKKLIDIEERFIDEFETMFMGIY